MTEVRHLTFEATDSMSGPDCREIDVKANHQLHKRVFLISSESGNEGHLDEVCDQISDALPDACLTPAPTCSSDERHDRREQDDG